MFKKLLTVAFLSLVLVACKTTSPKEKDTPPKNNQSAEMRSLYNDLKAKIAALKEEAIAIEANLFYPDQFAEALDNEVQMNQAFDDNDEGLMNDHGNRAILLLTDIIRTTRDNKDKIAYLRQAIERELAKGDTNEVYAANPDLFEFINSEYFKGVDFYANKNMAGALEAFSAAFYASQKVLAGNQQKEDQSAMRLLINEQFVELQRVAALKVANNKGVRVQPKDWNGADYLNDAPLLETVASRTRESLEGQNKAPSSVEDLIDKARTAWELAVLFNEQGQTDLAQEQLILSRQFSNTYAEYAILDIFTVRANQRPHDTLWKIAKQYYQDPFSWPLLWMRNRNLIKDPDLIYPGWRVMVPAIPQSKP